MLEDPNPESLRAYARDVGMMPLLDLSGAFDKSYQSDSIERFDRSERVLVEPNERLLAVIANEFDLPYYLDVFHAIQSRPQEKRRQIRDRMQKLIGIDRTEPTPDKLDQLESDFDFFKNEDFPYGISMARGYLCWIYNALGDSAMHDQCLRSSIEDHRRLGYTRMLCQGLGYLGTQFSWRGQIDSMRTCWDEGLDLALKYRLPDQAPRLLNFYARHYLRRGHTELAHRMLRESVALSDEYRGASHRQRFLIELAWFYAEIGFWELASRLVDRAAIVVSPDICSSVKADNLMLLRAEILMQGGRVDEGHRLFADVRDYYGDWASVGAQAMVRRRWANGLMVNGRADQALPIIEEGLRSFGPTDIELWLLRARASFALADWQGCDDALERFATFAAASSSPRYAEWLLHDSLRLEVSLARGDSGSAWQLGAIGLERSARFAESTDASTDGYLVTARPRAIRSSLYRLVRANPLLGYGAALHWVESDRRLGTGVSHHSDINLRDEPSARALVEKTFRVAGERSRSAVLSSGGVHLVYAAIGDEVWRWTVSRDGISQERLPISARSLRILIAEASEVVATTDVRKSLTPVDRLSDILLPRSIRLATASTNPVLITAVDCIGSFPFEVLNVGASGYTPLLARYDVAYLRPSGRKSAAPANRQALIFLSSAAPGRMRNRYPLHPPLRAAEIEARAAESMFPNARFLSGESATKKALLTHCENSSLVYVVGHVLRDPDAPYFVSLPATPPSENPIPEDFQVDVKDVRELDLSRCDLVILSGCSSGLNYSAHEATAPSLSQAFIDAGARNVVHTFWDVSDQQASDLMIAFMRHKQSGMSAVGALAEARRERMRDGDPTSLDWASYGIMVDFAGLPREAAALSDR